MTEKRVRAAEGQEIWSLTTGGRVWVASVDSKGNEKAKSVHGRGSRLRISTEDRELAQERTRDPKNDVFTNGTLVRIDADQNEIEETASPSALTDEQLLALLDKKQPAAFKKALDDLSEVAYRRMRTLVKDNEDVTASQQKVVQAVYDEKYNPNKDWVDPGGEDPNSIAASFPEVNLSTGKERKE
jgi:hypothetical protein